MTTRQQVVHSFFLQGTRSFLEGAPQREEYDLDEAFDEACKKYGIEWRIQYRHEGRCGNRDCPQCFPGS